jgi:hypothetical protein
MSGGGTDTAMSATSAASSNVVSESLLHPPSAPANTNTEDNNQGTARVIFRSVPSREAGDEGEKARVSLRGSETRRARGK